MESAEELEEPPAPIPPAPEVAPLTDGARHRGQTGGSGFRRGLRFAGTTVFRRRRNLHRYWRRRAVIFLIEVQREALYRFMVKKLPVLPKLVA